ncbi:hypothetical protein [Arthrobacter sp. SX1312]|uniref:hypothetical protein n=1 Tax=Arthrobacter sp. SX1312 TaxID=2058896 RepID=UPI000CE514D3|nr:hypothetical protein [Arthrobacter sp. SX1312]
MDQPALSSIDDAAVREVIGKFFTSRNAALALTGPLPAGLSLGLPSGDVQHPSVARPIADLPMPLWFELGGPPLALSFEVESGTEVSRNSALAVAQIASQRALDQLRKQQGIIYDISHQILEAEGERGIVCLTTDPRKKDAGLVLGEIRRILNDLAANGPDELELDQLIDDVRDFVADPRSAAITATDAARRHLLGERLISPQQMIMDTGAATRQMVQKALTLAEKTLMVGMPEGTSSSDPSLRMLGSENHEPVPGRSFERSLRGSFQGVPSKARLIIGADGVSLVDQMVTTILWEDVRGLEYAPHGISLHGIDAVSRELQQSWFAKANEAFALIEHHVEDALTYRVETS